MTPLMLQDTMVAEMKSLFADFYLKNVKGELVLPNIYPQHIPVKQSPKDTAHFPYIVVVLDSSEDIAELEPGKAKMFFITGTWNDADDYQGYRDNCNIIDKIYDHLLRVRLFNGFMVEYPLIRSYAVVGEGGEVKDNFPYFFGGIETNWTIGKVLMADPNI